MYDMNHLQTLVLHGGNLEGFHNTWTMVLSELSYVPDQDVLQYWYFKQLQHFKPMAEDIAHYKRAQFLPGGSPDYSFNYLWEASCRSLTMKRQDYMQNALAKSLKDPYAKALAGLDTKPSGKGDKKGKTPRSKSKGSTGKGKGSQSQSRSKSKEGKGSQAKAICYAFQKGTCTRGRHVDMLTRKNVGDPRPRNPANQKTATVKRFVLST